MSRNPEKARERKRRYLLRKKIAKYGPEAANVNMSGRHGNHAKGKDNGRWNSGRLVSSHGYALVRVGVDHPMAFGNGYAYEHDLVMVAAIGRRLAADEVVHHKSGDKLDNRLENLELTTASAHMQEHIGARKRDDAGRLLPEDVRVREFPATKAEGQEVARG
jgi:hypothetical protein